MTAGVDRSARIGVGVALEKSDSSWRLSSYSLPPPSLSPAPDERRGRRDDARRLSSVLRVFIASYKLLGNTRQLCRQVRRGGTTRLGGAEIYSPRALSTTIITRVGRGSPGIRALPQTYRPKFPSDSSRRSKVAESPKYPTGAKLTSTSRST